MGWNPANWQLTNTLQGQAGGYTNPLDNITGNIQSPSSLGNTSGSYGGLTSTTQGGGSPQPAQTGDGGGSDWSGFDANDLLTGGGGGTTTTTAAQQKAAADAAGIADTSQYLTDQQSQLQRILGSLYTSKDANINQLNTNYNTEKQTGENKYGEQVLDNTRNRQNAIGAVDTKARTGRNSLQRLLGMSGSAGQSAGQVADSAVARQASQDRASQLENSALNERNIENSKTSFLQQLLAKKNEREQGLMSDFYGQEQDLTGKIADVVGQRASVNGGNYAAVKAARAPYQATIDDRQNQLDGLFSKYATPFNQEAKLADLSQFNVDQTAINANKQFGASDSSPYAQFLARKRQTTV